MDGANAAAEDFKGAAELNESGNVVHCPESQSELGDDVISHLKPLAYRFQVRVGPSVSQCQPH